MNSRRVTSGPPSKGWTLILASVFTRHGGYASPHAFITGFTAAVWVAVGLSALGILAALIIPRARTARPATPQPQPSPALVTEAA
jgi:hypothetical protein